MEEGIVACPLFPIISHPFPPVFMFWMMMVMTLSSTRYVYAPYVSNPMTNVPKALAPRRRFLEIQGRNAAISHGRMKEAWDMYVQF